MIVPSLRFAEADAQASRYSDVLADPVPGGSGFESPGLIDFLNGLLDRIEAFCLARPALWTEFAGMLLGDGDGLSEP